ncbi:MAG: glycerol-3-phosphate 1-O-acyltransferase PlsY [Gammaproteobacteria bacterium]|nr:glycerol-3-phosphate 1-O-acyltransferase PlsY [Gammaproteobacteria bacterium]
MTALDIVLIVVAYLFGSLSTAVIVAKIMGFPDPRTTGSKNPGATNVLRHGGKKAAAFTLLGDSLKGVIPVLIAKAIGVDDLVLALVALMAFLGHLFPIFFGFKGGKGVATALGVLVAVSWPVGLLVLGTWLISAFITNISSLSALIASSLAPVYIWYITESKELFALGVAMALLIIIRHHSNIRHLLAGTEGRIKEKK